MKNLTRTTTLAILLGLSLSACGDDPPTVLRTLLAASLSAPCTNAPEDGPTNSPSRTRRRHVASASSSVTGMRSSMSDSSRILGTMSPGCPSGFSPSMPGKLIPKPFGIHTWPGWSLGSICAGRVSVPRRVDTSTWSPALASFRDESDKEQIKNSLK